LFALLKIDIKMAYECKFCKKNYINKKAYDNHYLKCEAINSLDCIEVIPSLKNIYKIVKTLVKENNNLKKRVNKLEDKLRKNDKQKVNIIDWLNDRNNNILGNEYIDYKNFINNFNKEITLFWKSKEYTINKLLNYGTVDILKIIINDIIYQHNILISFKNTNNIYYYSSNGWNLLSLSDFYALFQKIQKKMICDFFDYQRTTTIDTDKFNIMSNKIYANELSDEKKQKEVYNKISNLICKEIEKEINIKIIYQ